MRRVLLPLGVLILLLGLFCSRNEDARLAMLRVRSVDDFAQQGRALLWPPWRALITYVSIDDDVHLYFEYTRVLRREAPDFSYLGWEKDKIDLDAIRRRMKTGDFGYPPLAIAFMLTPRLVASTLEGYRVAFAVQVCLFYLLAWWLALRLTTGHSLDEARKLLWRAVAVTACLGPLLVGRFDVFPAFLVTVALLFMARGRPLAAGVTLLAGVAAKLYPLFLLPTWTAALFASGGAWRRRVVRLLIPFLAVFALAVLWLVSGSAHVDVGQALRVFGARPIQIESSVGALMRAFGAGIEYTFGSDNIPLPRGHWLIRALDVLLVAGPLLVAASAYRFFARRPALSDDERVHALVAFTAAAVLAVVLTSKLLSPQYLIWCLPLFALLQGASGRRAQAAICIALALTQIYFPFLYALVEGGNPVLLWLVVARNAVLVAATVYALRAPSEAASVAGKS